MSIYNPPPGTEDILPGEISAWQFIERKASEIFKVYGYSEIRTPIFEYTELFTRGIGEQTDVVQKEMYTFEDRGGRSLTLRPEGTAGVMRAIIPLLYRGESVRVYYNGPMFRGERPAAGRKRQFHQIGAENISQPSPYADAESICLLMNFIREIGIENTFLKINTRGSLNDRQTAGARLREMLSTYRDKLCEDCQRRFDRNIWRILDCKNPDCKAVIKGLDNLCGLFSKESCDYLDEVGEILRGEGIEFEKDPLLVRGLDYYAHTVFEVLHSGLGAQNAIAGGGRYEIPLQGLKEPLCGVGFACGVERLLMAAAAEGNKKISSERENFIYIISFGAESRRKNLHLAQRLREAGICTVVDYEERSMKSAMRAAGKSGAPLVIIRGENEINSGIVILKDMNSGSQLEVKEEECVDLVRNQFLS